eukprot:2524936-Amphidinium_carterae.1
MLPEAVSEACLRAANMSTNNTIQLEQMLPLRFPQDRLLSNTAIFCIDIQNWGSPKPLKR